MSPYLRQRYELERIEAQKRRESHAAKLRAQAAAPVRQVSFSAAPTPHVVTDRDIEQIRQSIKRAKRENS